MFSVPTEVYRQLNPYNDDITTNGGDAPLGSTRSLPSSSFSTTMSTSSSITHLRRSEYDDTVRRENAALAKRLLSRAIGPRNQQPGRPGVAPPASTVSGSSLSGNAFIEHSRKQTLWRQSHRTPTAKQYAQQLQNADNERISQRLVNILSTPHQQRRFPAAPPSTRGTQQVLSQPPTARRQHRASIIPSPPYSAPATIGDTSQSPLPPLVGSPIPIDDDISERSSSQGSVLASNRRASNASIPAGANRWKNNRSARGYQREVEMENIRLVATLKSIANANHTNAHVSIPQNGRFVPLVNHSTTKRVLQLARGTIAAHEPVPPSSASSSSPRAPRRRRRPETMNKTGTAPIASSDTPQQASLIPEAHSRDLKNSHETRSATIPTSDLADPTDTIVAPSTASVAA
jgi:hypothetical protein